MATYYRSASAVLSLVIVLALVIGPAPSALLVYADDTGTSDTTDSAETTDTSGTTDTGTDTSGTEGATDTGTATTDTSGTTTGDTGTSGDAAGAGAAAAATTTEPGPDITVATSTDGTGGQTGGTIETGDATASTTVENELNTNISNGVDGPGKTNSSTITSENTNTADLGSDDVTEAATGENTADGGESLATIVTGSAVSTANVINVVNTNIFNSEGLILFLNQLFGGGIDLRSYDLSYFFGGPTSPCSPGEPCSSADATSQCTLLTCLNSSALNVLNTNTATVTNSVIVRAATGENTASTTGMGDASIDTGDAYAAANVFNLANSNIINSNYLLVTFNNFGNLGDDIILPNADFFKQLLLNGGTMPQMNSSTYTVNNTNDTDFTGTTTADAITGENMASSTSPMATSTATTTPQTGGSGVITTGNAYSSASSFTSANTDQIGGTSIFLLFRVWGNWTGTVQGLPDGIKWMQTPDGIQLVSDNSSTTPAQTVGQYNSSSFLASSTNTANIENNVQVYALTGENKALTESGTPSVNTGNAYAAANVVNLVNTNVIGRNWIFAIFNIFGDWSGNISFGRPDLWIGAVAETPNPTPPGAEVKYTFTVANHGDADANNVTLKADFDRGMLEFLNPGAVSTSDTGLTWNLGTIAKGESRDFEYVARANSLRDGRSSMNVPLNANVTAAEADNNTVDNTETVTIMVANPAAAAAAAGSSGGSGGSGGAPVGLISFPGTSVWQSDPLITMEKTASASVTQAPATVDYKVVVTNAKGAGPVYRGVLTDTLYAPDGGVMYTRSWDLDTVAPGDQITLTYSVEYAADTKPGTYKNVARLTGKKNYSNPAAATDLGVTEVTKEITFGAAGEVLGLATSTPETSSGGACTPILTTYLKPGRSNRSGDVQVLQIFLNSQGAGLPVTGYFGPMTTGAVKSFQRTYASDILAPVGLRAPSGLVYSMTLNKINSLACGGLPVAQGAIQPAVPNTGAVSKKPVKTNAVAKPAPKKTTKAPAPKPAAAQPAKTAEIPAPKPAPKSGIKQWLKNIIPFASAQSN